MTIRVVLPILAALAVSACASDARRPALEGVATTVDPFELQTPSASSNATYSIGPSDKLSLSVFGVEGLSFPEIHVDAGGNLQLPLIGSVRAAGLTSAELSREIERRLGERYLRHPQVMVSVTQAAAQKVTVDGAVTKPGVYEMRGQTTLVQAVAMAEGATPVADLNSVAVFRTVEGRRMVAVFSLRDIRNAQTPDPVLLGDDIVVVDTSRLSANLQTVLQALPGLAVFAYF